MMNRKEKYKTKDFYLHLILNNSISLSDIPKEYIDNEILLNLINNSNTSNFTELKPYINFNDRDFCIKAASKNILFISILPDYLKKDKDFIKSVLNSDDLNLEIFGAIIDTDSYTLNNHSNSQITNMNKFRYPKI